MNSSLNVAFRESPLDSPFMPKEKKWIAAAIAAGASLLGSAVGAVSNSSTNEANKEMNDANIKMQKDTNQMQIDMMREQNAFNLDMWNKENQYNSPAAQVGRLLAAGINPAGVLGGNNTGNASSLVSGNVPALTAPHNSYEMRPTDFSGITESGVNAVNAYNSSRMLQSETRNKDALTANTVFDTTYKQKTMQDNLRYLRNIAKGSGWQADMAKKQLEFYEATLDYDIQMKYGDTLMQKKSLENLEKQMRYQDLQNDILEIQKGYAHQMSQAQIAQLWSSVHQANAQIGLINANVMLTNEQRLHEIEKRVGQTIDNGMKGVDMQIKKATKNSIIQSYKNSANIGMWEAFDKWKHGSNGNNRGVADQFGVDHLSDFAIRKMKALHYIPKF